MCAAVEAAHGWLSLAVSHSQGGGAPTQGTHFIPLQIIFTVNRRFVTTRNLIKVVHILVRAPLESYPNRPQFLINNQRQARLWDPDCLVVLSEYQKVNKDD